MTPNEREIIYTELKNFHGSFVEVAKRTGYHRNYVQNVLAGKDGYDNTAIVEAAAELLVELRQKEAERLENIKRLTAQAMSITL